MLIDMLIDTQLIDMELICGAETWAKAILLFCHIGRLQGAALLYVLTGKNPCFHDALIHAKSKKRRGPPQTGLDGVVHVFHVPNLPRGKGAGIGDFTILGFR